MKVNKTWNKQDKICHPYYTRIWFLCAKILPLKPSVVTFTLVLLSPWSVEALRKNTCCNYDDFPESNSIESHLDCTNLILLEKKDIQLLYVNVKESERKDSKSLLDREHRSLQFRSWFLSRHCYAVCWYPSYMKSHFCTTLDLLFPGFGCCLDLLSICSKAPLCAL